jgi:hypothetical protein
VAAKLGVAVADVEEALIRWASEQNLESRLLPGAVDPTVLAVLESGVGPILEHAAAEVPAEGWPA